MTSNIHSDWVSEKRFQEYLDAASQNAETASRLYEWNARVSSALFESIHHFEVLLRNAIIKQLHEHGAGPNMPPGTPWVQGAASIQDVTRRIERRGKTATEARVYSGLTFGFWQQLFGPEFEELWRHTLRFVFRHSKSDRKVIAAHLEAINVLRNRIAHHGSLLGRDTEVELRRVLRLTSWIDPQAADWLSSIETVTELSRTRPVRPERNVMVVPASDAWNLYHDKKQDIYVFPVDRHVQLVEYIAFYADQEIKPVIPHIEARYVSVDWTRANAKRLSSSGNPHDQVIGKAIFASIGQRFPLSAYQVFVLTAPKANRTVTLNAPIEHSKRGRGSAFAQGRRYLSLSKLLSASDTHDLI